MRLKDKVAIITGGANGLGKAASLRFAEEGAIVVVADMNIDQGNQVVKEITDKGGVAIFLQTNVADRESCDALAQETVGLFGRIDILVNNAGITRDARLINMTDEQWRQVMSVNLDGVFYLTRAVVPTMLSQGSGSVITTSSVVGVAGGFGQANYGSTKGAVIAMMRGLAKEYGAKGLRFNTVAPGFIGTDMVMAMPQKAIDKMVANVPMGRLGKPEEIANAYLFLASDESSYVSGTCLEVDGCILF